MPGELLGERVGDGHGVDQHHHEKGEEIEAGDQATDLFTVVVINGAGDPAPGAMLAERINWLSALCGQ
jgi:hypothetical protein